MNNMLEYKGYYGTVELSGADNVLFGKVIGVNSLISYEGDSVQHLRDDFQGAVNEYLEMCAENGVEPEKTYKGSLMYVCRRNSIKHWLWFRHRAGKR